MAKRWYIVHALANFEKKVAEQIKEKADSTGLGHLFDDVIVPVEKVVEMRRGKRVESERRYFPGYVLVNVDLTDDAFHLIKNTPKVTGFLGAERNKPSPITAAEAERILGLIKDGATAAVSAINFEIGDTVRVTEGPFASFSGIVEDVDPGKSKLTVAVSIFGRATPMQLEFNQVEKAA